MVYCTFMIYLLLVNHDDKFTYNMDMNKLLIWTRTIISAPIASLQYSRFKKITVHLFIHKFTKETLFMLINSMVAVDLL